MTNFHNYSFFGKATGIIFQSGRRSDPYVFIRCIKKKNGNIWEKPSKGEGKAIKLNLEEIVMIINVLQGKIQKWSSYHKYKGDNTQISFNWEMPKNNNFDQKLWINIGEYAKMLNFAQVEILRVLLQHVFDEKIEFSTTSNNFSNEKPNKGNIDHKKRNENNPKKEKSQNSHLRSLVVEEQEIIYENSKESEQTTANGKSTQINENKSTEILGIIKAETKKALLVIFQDGKECWIPKSVVRSEYNSKEKMKQSFNIDNWILRKNGIIS